MSHYYSPLKGYKGFRTNHRYAYDLTIRYDREAVWKTRGRWDEIRSFFYELEDWCEENATGPWSRNGDRFFFEKRDDLMLFKLTFMGMI